MRSSKTRSRNQKHLLLFFLFFLQYIIVFATLKKCNRDTSNTCFPRTRFFRTPSSNLQSVHVLHLSREIGLLTKTEDPFVIGFFLTDATAESSYLFIVSDVAIMSCREWCLGSKTTTYRSKHLCISTRKSYELRKQLIPNPSLPLPTLRNIWPSLNKNILNISGSQNLSWRPVTSLSEHRDWPIISHLPSWNFSNKTSTQSTHGSVNKVVTFQIQPFIIFYFHNSGRKEYSHLGRKIHPHPSFHHEKGKHQRLQTLSFGSCQFALEKGYKTGRYKLGYHYLHRDYNI